MEVKISQWGHSLGLRIPKPLAEQAGLKPGDAMEIAATADGLTLRKRHKPPRFDLKRLVAGITQENRHEEVDWGPAAGREIW